MSVKFQKVPLPTTSEDNTEEKYSNPPQEDMSGKVINDCVHGHMEFPTLLLAIIDTPEFQRLRYIKQMGTVYYVYPSGVNTRFEHSLGTCFLARKLINSLKRNGLEISEKQKWCVEIAALCHDLGHGPFSHTWEQFLKQEKVTFEHEDASIKLLEKILSYEKVASELRKHNILENEIEEIKRLIKGDSSKASPKDHYLYQIVANKDFDVDVDKWEYLARDQLLLNQRASFDYKRLLYFCKVMYVKEKDQWELCFRDKEVQHIMEMFVTRANLHEKAYQHHVVKVVEQMLIDALSAANREAPELNLTSTNIDDLSQLTDHVYYLIRNHPKTKTARDIILRIENRQLYQRVYVCNLEKYGIDLEAIISSADLDNFRDRLHELLSNNNEKPVREEIGVIPVNVSMGSKASKGRLLRIFTYSKERPEVAKQLTEIGHIFESSVTKNTIKMELLIINKGKNKISLSHDEVENAIETCFKEKQD